jgi:hypothetical protein
MPEPGLGFQSDGLVGMARQGSCARELLDYAMNKSDSRGYYPHSTAVP